MLRFHPPINDSAVRSDKPQSSQLGLRRLGGVQFSLAITHVIAVTANCVHQRRHSLECRVRFCIRKGLRRQRRPFRFQFIPSKVSAKSFACRDYLLGVQKRRLLLSGSSLMHIFATEPRGPEPYSTHMHGGPASLKNVALSENHPWMPIDGAP